MSGKAHLLVGIPPCIAVVRLRPVHRLCLSPVEHGLRVDTVPVVGTEARVHTRRLVEQSRIVPDRVAWKHISKIQNLDLDPRETADW